VAQSPGERGQEVGAVERDEGEHGRFHAAILT
jgi:hypothetical protein